MTTHTPTSTPAMRYAVICLPADGPAHTDQDVRDVVGDIDDTLGRRGYAYPLDELDTATRADLAAQLAAIPPADAGTAHLAAVAANPAHTYVDSTTAPLPGRVTHGTDPTSDLLDRVRGLYLARERGLITEDERNIDAAKLLADAVQVIRTVAVDTLRVAAGDVFDTAMPAYVARWLEARAAVLELGKDVHDPDVMDYAIAEMTARARARAQVTP